MEGEGDLVAARFDRGSRCFGAWMGDDLAGYGWLSTATEWIGEIELEIGPGAGDGYIWNCMVLPEYRRKGIFRSLLAGITGLSREDGLRRLWIGSVAIPAERAVGPSGYKPALRISSAVIAGMCWLKVRQAEEADPDLVEAAREALGIGGVPLRLATTMRRSRPRRH
ncbi:MAG: GNAT family N-acetyltransferase [Candidatus Dormiibacterota bacterium]